MTTNRFARLLSTILVLVAILLSASCLTVSTQQPGQGEQPQNIWTGKWESEEWGTMDLTQTGSSVTGTYTWDQGKIDGTVNGDILGGTWSEEPSYAPPTDAGDFEFTLSSDGNSFTGKWRYGSSGEWDGDWSGERIR
ncbi:MAG: hypothetical protein H8E40_12215 [Chloroflexi bacterium]|nr:hypothetical protein [Chloroflexota bacterium]